MSQWKLTITVNITNSLQFAGRGPLMLVFVSIEDLYWVIIIIASNFYPDFIKIMKMFLLSSFRQKMGGFCTIFRAILQFFLVWDQFMHQSCK